MKRRAGELARARRRQRLFTRVAGVQLPGYRFRSAMPRHACFSREREWVVAAAKRRVERQTR